jgi:hypothetical protein
MQAILGSRDENGPQPATLRTAVERCLMVQCGPNHRLLLYYETKGNNWSSEYRLKFSLNPRTFIRKESIYGPLFIGICFLVLSRAVLPNICQHSSETPCIWKIL